MKNKWRIGLIAVVIGLSVALLPRQDSTVIVAGSAQAQEAAAAASTQSSPPDTRPYVRPLVPEDLSPGGLAPLGSETQALDSSGAALLGSAGAGIFIVDVVVNNTDASLTNTDTENDGEVSIAVNPSNPDEIVIAAFSGPTPTSPPFLQGWQNGATNATIYHSLDGGLTWTQQGVPPPNGITVRGPNDWAWDFGRNNDVYATVLNNSNIITGGTTDPTMPGVWQWNDIAGVTQITNLVAGINGREDQPWLLVNPDPFTPAQDNTYVAYDDFANTDGVDGPDLRVATSYGLTPPDFSAAMGGVDVQVGNTRGFVNPGLRLAEDPRTGFMWALWGRCIAADCSQFVTKDMDYKLNRSTDGGATWGLNAAAFGIVVANADSTQPQPKFGTVNALLGGVHHASVDPNTGDLYYAYGNRDAVTGNNRLAMRRVFDDGAGGVIVGPENFITGQVQAAIPVVEVTDNGVVGVFYYTFDGFSSDDLPIFTAHFAISEDKGVTFTDHELVTFLSSAPDSGNTRQRVLGDYMQMQTIGNCFYGGFTANGAPFGRPFANHDPIFFKTCVGAFRKDVTSGPDADGDGEIDVVVEVGQLATTEYDFTIGYSNLGGPPVLIVDTAPAEWIVTEVGGQPVDVDQCGESETVFNDFGLAVVFRNGKLGRKCRSSTKIFWRPDPDGGEINVVMTTRQSPGTNNVKFAPTSCGPLFLNSGPARVFEVDPATGAPLRDPVTGELLPPLFTAEPLLLVAVEDVDGDGIIVPDGSGNEDGDALTDLQDVQHGFDPCSVGTGTLYAGTDQEEFAELTEDRLAATPVVGGVPGATVIVTPDDFVNGLAPTGTGTLFSGDPGSSDHHEITVAGTTLSTVVGPLPGHRFNEDLAFDGTHVWRAHWEEGPLFKYLPDGTLVDSFDQTDVIGATFVWPADQLWITKWNAKQVGTFDPGTNTFTSVFGTGANAGGLAYDIERGILWVGHQGGAVRAFDLTAGAALIAGSGHMPFGVIDDTVDGLAFIAD